MTTPPARLISCDEAGFTGPRMLDDDQPVFAYTAIDLTPAEAAAIVAATRQKYRVQAPELKAQGLRRRDNWSEIALDLARQLEGRALIMVCDKRLNLGGKAFEYLFEPVLQANNTLFYRHNLHRFVMNGLYGALYKTGEPPHQLAEEMQAFMRSFKPEDAPKLFAANKASDESSVILDCVLRFARGYAGTIAAESQSLQPPQSLTGKWTLDLTTTALFSLTLQGFGLRYPRIELLCDDSKPLKDMAHIFDGWVGRTDQPAITDGRRETPIGMNLAGPMRFGSSLEHPTIQLADVLSGASADFIKRAGAPEFAAFGPWLDRHLHPNHLLPDAEVIDTSQLEPRVNLAVLRELARRADVGADPLANMEGVYAAAFDRFRSPAARVRRPRRGERRRR
ncbi:DUF3800 domain-containing protein [Xanthobacter sediminis]|uniref:DUF3800 domain-containing protein n=1 Tax=Xanthobacter sediminis TaxID=3119926 RepID=UPI0037261EBD